MAGPEVTFWVTGNGPGRRPPPTGRGSTRRRHRDGHRPEAAAWIGAYSINGFYSEDVSPGDLRAFQNTFVVLDVVLGALLFGFVLWTALVALRAPAPAREPQVIDAS
jgi:hypothetical protein